MTVKASYSILMLLSAIYLTGCSDRRQMSDDIRELAMEECSLKLELSHLQDSIRGTWNHVNDIIETALPQDMPEEEKSNMLKVRNAELIRMFETYDGLDDTIKQTVNSAEMIDQKVAGRVIDLRHQLGSKDEEKLKLFSKAYEKGDHFLEEIKADYASIIEACE